MAMLDRLCIISKFLTMVNTNPSSGTVGIQFAGFAGGTIYLTAVANTTTITWWTSPDLGASWFAAYDATNTAITQSVAPNAAQSYQIPTALFGAATIYPVISGGATSVPYHYSLKG